MSELLDKQVNAQNKKTISGVHFLCAMKMKEEKNDTCVKMIFMEGSMACHSSQNSICATDQFYSYIRKRGFGLV